MGCCMLPRPARVAFCGKCDAWALPGRQRLIPAKMNQLNELPAIRSNPYGYKDPAAADGQQPILARSPVGPFMPLAAVNAYYHCDRFFRLVQGLGFTLGTFFSGTTLPTPVDHRGRMNTTDGVEVNAHCLGTGSSGILRTTFALADTADTANPIGIACDWRVVLHELGGHGILYPHVHSANFGFSHSAGDSFAAILNDPISVAADRFVTFPWVNIGRRHDRPVNGWAWYGLNDVGGYSTEQILATTHFRIYRSLGGDAALPAGLGSRQFAARFTSYLILRAVASLSPAANPPKVDSGWTQALAAADLGDWTSEGDIGGAYGKVIRWAFEKQGLYQPAGTMPPVSTAG